MSEDSIQIQELLTKAYQMEQVIKHIRLIKTTLAYRYYWGRI